MSPLVIEFFKRLLPFALAASVGFAAAFYIQGLRITAEKQRLTEYRQMVAEERFRAEQHHQDVNQEVSDAWSKNLEALRDCYRSGRCRVPVQAGGSGITVPNAAAGVNAAGANAVPTAARVAEDCAETTLQLNSVQGWIERMKQ